MKLFVVEDEEQLADTLAKSLRNAGNEVDMCHDGALALEQAQTERCDLILLDLNLPGVDGMSLLRALRAGDADTKVLILSARDQIADKVEGLDAGANDSLSKPFHLSELEARIRSLTRRRFTQNSVCLTCGQLSFHMAT